MKKRIWNSTTEEHRELERLKRNEHKDILLHLDGGEVWQFTPESLDIGTPAIERIKLFGHCKDSKTGERSPLAAICLENPKETIWGNLRKLPVAECDTQKPNRKPKRGAKPKYGAKEESIFKRWMTYSKSGGTKEDFWNEEELNKTMGLDDLKKLIAGVGRKNNKDYKAQHVKRNV